MIPDLVVAAEPPEAVSTALLVGVGPPAALRDAPWFEGLAAALDGPLRLAAEDTPAGECAVLAAGQGLSARRIGFVVPDPRIAAPGDAMRQAAGAAVREARRRGLPDLALLVPDGTAEDIALAAQRLAEGALAAGHEGDRVRTSPSPARFRRVSLVPPPGQEEAVARGARRGRAVGRAVAFARELAAMPPNLRGPAEVASLAAALAEAEPRITVDVLDEPALAAHGLHALRAVGQGSRRPPCLVVARYTPRALPAGARPLVLIGKTVTFDSGGLSLKPALDMDRQKADLGGGAAVLGALRAAAELDLPVEIVALLPTAENMPGGQAMRPGDVVRTLAGPTVEVLNTDAEGRLILADALAYADRFAPRLVVDLATLTGASAIVFGPVGLGFFCNDEPLAAAIARADAIAGERLWRLPLWPEHQALLRSDVADLANISTTHQQGSMLTAAGFLARFAGAAPWAHLDLYNTAWNTDGSHPTLPRGPTGSGTRTLVQLLIGLADTTGAP